MLNIVEEIYRKRSEKFKTGILLVFLFSLTVVFFNAKVFYLCGFPVYGLLLGYIYIWIADEEIKYKLYGMLLSAALILYSFSMSILLVPNADQEIFLIPKTLNGQPVAIVFERMCGETITYENKSRVYDFSASGILIIKDKRLAGKPNRKFYLVDEDGKRTELPEFHHDKFDDENAEWHWITSKRPLTRDLAGNYPEYYSTTLNMYVFSIGSYESFEIIDRFDPKSKNERLGEFEKRVEKLIEKCEKPYWRKS